MGCVYQTLVYIPGQHRIPVLPTLLPWCYQLPPPHTGLFVLCLLTSPVHTHTQRERESVCFATYVDGFHGNLKCYIMMHLSEDPDWFDNELDHRGNTECSHAH